MDLTRLKKRRHSFFKEGSLEFKASGHKLIKSNGYYRCAKDTNQKCTYAEKQIKSETLERNFSRLATTLHVKNFPALKVIERLLRDHFWDVVFGLDDRQFGKHDVLDATLSVMKEDVKEKGEVGEDLVIDFIDTFEKEKQDDFPVILFAFAISVVQSVSMDLKEAEMGRTLALFSKKIYLNNDGKIESIELERWVWYLFNNVIERNSPGFIKSLSKINIINKEDELHKLNLYEASFKYGEEGFEDAMGENQIMNFGWINMIKKSFEQTLINNPKDAKEGLPKLFQAIRNDIPLNALINSLSIIK